MTTLNMYKNLGINMTNLSQYIWISHKTLSRKLSEWYEPTEEQLKKMREYLDIKVREMIKIIKKIDKVLDNTEQNEKDI